MYERHEREQYFFDSVTLRRIGVFLEQFEYPCLLCAPLLGAEMARAGRRVRVLDILQPIAVSYLSRRASAVVGTFGPFGLQPTGYKPTYQSVKPIPRNEVELFSNLDTSALESLLAAA